MIGIAQPIKKGCSSSSKCCNTAIAAACLFPARVVSGTDIIGQQDAAGPTNIAIATSFKHDKGRYELHQGAAVAVAQQRWQQRLLASGQRFAYLWQSCCIYNASAAYSNNGSSLNSAAPAEAGELAGAPQSTRAACCCWQLLLQLKPSVAKALYVRPSACKGSTFVGKWLICCSPADAAAAECNAGHAGDAGASYKVRYYAAGAAQTATLLIIIGCPCLHGCFLCGCAGCITVCVSVRSTIAAVHGLTDCTVVLLHTLH